MNRGQARRERGFTLVEIMIALLISAMLVGVTLSIFSRMSLAFRTQQNVGDLQQVLSAAQAQLSRDLRQAGFGIPDGFFFSGDQVLYAPLQIENNADGFGPDLIKIYAADPSAQARVTALTATQVTVDDVDWFEPNDVAVIVGYDGGLQNSKIFTACIVQIDAVYPGSPGTIDLNQAGVYGTAAHAHCDGIRPNIGVGSYTTMIYRFRARAYRIDPTRRNLAVLQVSTSGGIRPDDWQDLGVGFTDLQVASRWYEEGNDLAADDGDPDPAREWYSGEQQELLSLPLQASGAPYLLPQSYVDPLGRQIRYQPAPISPAIVPPEIERHPVPTEVRVSLVLRSHNRIDSVPSARTPALIDPARPNHNQLGDRASIQLEGVADPSRPDELQGDHVYRYATVGSDLRNLGVGQ